MSNQAQNDLQPWIARFLSGDCDDAYRYLGAHPAEEIGRVGGRCRVWAPNAALVAVMGDFNGWDGTANPMQPMGGGIWELFLPGLTQCMLYKYAVHTRDGRMLTKADPYAFHAQMRPDNASRLYDIGRYQWGDAGWLAYRRRNPVYRKPVNIYEVHLGSWRRTGVNEFLTYREIARWLVPYVKEMGYTHVEFMPVTEHPLDMSWGYQVTGYFAPTARYGTPDDFRYLVDQLHQAGVGVLLDWVPAHFPKDAFGLYEFDGTPCYEDADPKKRDHPEWGTRVFDFGRAEVLSFLCSSAMYWLNEYHADGLRVDAVASMLYLDYGRKAGEWTPNVRGGRENLEAVAFLRRLNATALKWHPDALMIAEESSSWEHITGPLEQSDTALGFNYKWNMGWMNDALHYQKMDAVFRQYNHRDLTFPLMYAFRENFILPISHDEVVHMKGSMPGKMPGNDEQKLAGVRAFFLYMMTMPGKKLTMMGTELGQFREWHYEYSLDWHLLEQSRHAAQRRFFRDLNRLYLSRSELWEIDDSRTGFAWVEPDDANANTLIYLRRNRKRQSLLIAVNFSPNRHRGYCIGVPDAGSYEVLLDSDAAAYGGDGQTRPVLKTENNSCHGFDQSLFLDIAPYSGVILRCCRRKTVKKGRKTPSTP